MQAERRAENDDAKFVANIEKILQLTQDTTKMMFFLENVIKQVIIIANFTPDKCY